MGGGKRDFTSKSPLKQVHLYSTFFGFVWNSLFFPAGALGISPQYCQGCFYPWIPENAKVGVSLTSPRVDAQRAERSDFKSPLWSFGGKTLPPPWAEFFLYFMCNQYMDMHMYICIYICMYKCAFVHVCMYMICIYVHVYL